MNDRFSVAGKSVLVTGASSGIGRTIATMLAAMGAGVTIVGRNADRLQETFSSLKGNGHEMVVADLTQKEDVQRLAQRTFSGVVFNAGIVEYLPVRFITAEKIAKIFDTNFNSTVLLCQQLLKNKLVAKGGSLVFISSISSVLGVPGTALYASSKAAVTAFAKVVAAEVAGQGIRSNSICPGIILTPMTENAKTATSEKEVSEAEKSYPLGYGTTEDVAGVVIFLLSDASRWMTGSELILDGGLTLK